MSRRRQVRAFLSESRSEAERWAAAVQCLLREVIVTSDTGKLLAEALLFSVEEFLFESKCKHMAKNVGVTM